MDITAISDIHGFLPTLSGGDLLVVAGDLTARDKASEFELFAQWLSREGAKYQKAVWIGGNHDGLLEHHLVSTEIKNSIYLCDSGVELDGYRIWGSPYTPTFMNWHFMRNRGSQIKKHWDLIPTNTDILITHGPPYGILDANDRGEPCGCQDLWDAVQRIQPKLHIFGHIHEGYGIHRAANGVTFINASYVDEYYRPINKPVQVKLGM